MKVKEKLAFMILGGLLVFLGQLLPHLMSGTSLAQDEKLASFEHITCKGLQIRDGSGNSRIVLDNTGKIGILTEDGKVAIVLSVDSKGRRILINGTDDTPRSSFLVNGDEGTINLLNKKGNFGISMWADENGGTLRLNNEEGSMRVALIVDKANNGAVRTFSAR